MHICLTRTDGFAILKAEKNGVVGDCLQIVPDDLTMGGTIGSFANGILRKVGVEI